jgi:hypothetical protein
MLRSSEKNVKNLVDAMRSHESSRIGIILSRGGGVVSCVAVYVGTHRFAYKSRNKSGYEDQGCVVIPRSKAEPGRRDRRPCSRGSKNPAGRVFVLDQKGVDS